jgi:hypothetical protein
MGAWDYGIIDDNTAYDFTDEIKTNAQGFFKVGRQLNCQALDV